MSQTQQNPVQTKQLVICLTRFGQIIAVYSRFEDAEIIIKDAIVKGQTIDMSIKYVQ